MENTITITREEYNELIRASERIAAVERLCTRGDYVSVGDVKHILDIKEPVTGETENG